ncbi:MAG: LamG-like jellyroll fold domain-containing protein [Saprospiraceae bacterium]
MAKKTRIEKLIIVWIVFLPGFCLQAQAVKNLIAYFTFDSCTITDTQKKATGAFVGPLTCACGVSGNALSWNGGLNFAEWQSNEIKTFTESDFSVSFYFNPKQATGTMDILSKRENCGIDSFFAIRYISDQRTLVAELVQRVDNNGSLNIVLPDNRCWFHITFTRAGNKLTLYLDGEEKASKTNNYLISVSNTGKFALANSPCLAVTDIRYKGILDELKLFNKALTRDEVKSLYTPIDFLLTRDTVIFKGDRVQTRWSRSCATSYKWFPSTGVSDINTSNAILSPAQTTLYYLESVQEGCVIRDTIKVIVIDAGDLDCTAVQMPNAFTPNDDGLNDLYRISNPYVISSLNSFEVFDRWGERVFLTTDPSAGWDGTFGSQQVNPGLFVYHLKYVCKGNTLHKSGSFTLIR